MRSVVVLPQPLGPSSVVSVPRGDAKADGVDGERRARVAAVALRDGAQLDAAGGVVALCRVHRLRPRRHAGTGTSARRPSVRSPTSHWISATASDISAISTVQ